jgi:hypothetical protein
VFWCISVYVCVFCNFCCWARSLLSSHIERGRSVQLIAEIFLLFFWVCILLFLGGLFLKTVLNPGKIYTRVLYFICILRLPGLWYVLDVSYRQTCCPIAVRSHYETFDGSE